MKIEFQSTVLLVSNIQRARGFYEDLLGQKVVLDFGVNVTFAGGWALWQVDRAFEMIYNQSYDEQEPVDRRSLELYFETDDLDTAWEMLQQAQVPVVHAILEQPWGQRVVRVYDPDGYVVEVGEPMQVVVRRLLKSGMTLKEVAKHTSMPLEIVEQMMPPQ